MVNSHNLLCAVYSRTTAGKVELGVRKVFSTNAASKPWIQLDLGQEMQVKKVGGGQRRIGRKVHG